MNAGKEKVVDTEFEEDEVQILANQDETSPGGVNADDIVMGAGPTNRLSRSESGEFVRGEVDVVEQMERAAKAIQRGDRTDEPTAQD